MQQYIRSFIISSLLSLGLFCYIFYSETAQWPAPGLYWPGLLLGILLANILGFSMLFLNRIFNKTLSWQQSISFRFMAETGSGIVVFALLAGLFVILYVQNTAALHEGENFMQRYQGTIIKTAFFRLSSFACIH